MTQHSSLKNASVGKRHRNVLKRYERIQTLKVNETWGERQSVYKLPKQKLIKLKVKKAKGKEETAEAGAAEGQATAPVQTAQKAPPQDKGKTKEK